MMMALSASSMAMFSDGRKDNWGEGQGKRKWKGNIEMHWAPRMHIVSIFVMYYSRPALKARVPFSSTWVYLSRKLQKVHGPKCLFANGSQMTNSSQVTLSGSSPGVCVCVHAQSLNCVSLFATPWTIVLQAPLSMEFSRQEYWSGFPGDLPKPGIKPGSPALQEDSLPSEPPGRPAILYICITCRRGNKALLVSARGIVKSAFLSVNLSVLLLHHITKVLLGQHICAWQSLNIT